MTHRLLPAAGCYSVAGHTRQIARIVQNGSVLIKIDSLKQMLVEASGAN